MKNFFFKTIKVLVIGGLALFLTTVGIDAVDRRDGLSESIIGRWFFGASSGPCPEDMTLVSTGESDFCIDRFENSAGDDCPQLSVSNQEQTRDNINASDCRALSESGRIPWRYVSVSQAANICAKVGKRLPTNAEWYAASLGTPDKNAAWLSDDCNVATNWGQAPGATGSGKNCQSGAGAFDMIGNVWEWVSGEADNGIFENDKLPPAGFVKIVDSRGVIKETDPNTKDPNFNDDYFWLKETGVRGIARGGYWNNNSEAGLYAMYLEALPTAAIDGIGFRCAKSTTN